MKRIWLILLVLLILWALPSQAQAQLIPFDPIEDVGREVRLAIDELQYNLMKLHAQVQWYENNFAVSLSRSWERERLEQEPEGLECFTFPYLSYLEAYLQTVKRDESVVPTLPDIVLEIITAKPLQEVLPITNQTFVDLLVEYEGCIPSDVRVYEQGN